MAQNNGIIKDWTNYNNLSEKLQQLINTSFKNKEEWATRTSFLFKQKERLQNLLDFEKNPVILNAYLTIQSFKYSEKGVMSVERLFEIIEKETELSEEKIKKWENKEFFDVLDKKIANKEISVKQLTEKINQILAKNK